MKIAIIGAGNMGGALALGLADSRCEHNSSICISNPSLPKLQRLREKAPALTITQNNLECVADADVVFLAVKPRKAKEVIREIAPGLKTNVIFASVVTGFSAQTIREDLAASNPSVIPAVFYVIPNTAIEVRQSMTFLCEKGASSKQIEFMEQLFSCMGTCMLMEERMMGAGLALASCGIAYALRYVRAATEGGVELGLFPEEAQRIVTQTLRGAISLLEKNGSHPEVEIDRVTTPGGITIRGLNAMEENGFTNSIIQGLKASKI